MGTVKPWQIVVMVLAVLAVVGSVLYSCSGSNTGVDVASEMRLVDVKTGEFFVAKLSDKQLVTLPAKNPTSGEPTLFPVYEKEGAWYITSRTVSAARSVKGLKEGLITDPKSGKLGADFSNPSTLSIPK
jgi:hypothetical protein